MTQSSEVIAMAEKQISVGILAMTGVRKAFYIRETIIWGRTLTVKFSMEGSDGFFVWHFDIDELLETQKNEN